MATNNNVTRCGKCGGIKNAAATPPQTSWTLDQARVARGKLADQNSSAARRAMELIDLAFPSLAAEAAAQRQAPAMPTVAATVAANSGVAAKPVRSNLAFPNPEPRTAAYPSAPSVSAPAMPSMTERIKASRAKK